MNNLLIDLTGLMITLYIANSLFLWAFVRSYREEMRFLYEKIELLEGITNGRIR